MELALCILGSSAMLPGLSCCGNPLWGIQVSALVKTYFVSKILHFGKCGEGAGKDSKKRRIDRGRALKQRRREAGVRSVIPGVLALADA